MSKGNSGLFNGTKGANRINGVNPNVQKEKAFEYAKSIFENGTKLEKAKLNTVSVVYDEENDKYYYGMNRGIELHHSPKNAILFGDDKWEGGYDMRTEAIRQSRWILLAVLVIAGVLHFEI